MKKLFFILLLFSSSILIAQTTGTITVNVPGAATTQALKDSIKVLRDSLRIQRLAISKATAGVGTIGPKGDKGDPGPPGRDGVNTGGSFAWFYSVKNVRDFGGDPSNKDYSDAITQGIEYCVKNNVRKLFFPLGVYNFSKSQIIKSTGFVTLELEGESSFWDSNMGSVLNYTGTDGFAIGIQNGKGCKIRKFTINGRFQPPFGNDRKKFFASKFEDFKDGVCRDSRYSPHAAIIIDPFTNIPGQIPGDGGYPALKQYYGAWPGFSTQTGSTGIELEELSINNFVVGIGSSVNGMTRNAEISIFNKIQFENVKLAVANCTDQEKMNVISNIYCWGGTHTIFANGQYGGAPNWYMAGNYVIDHANLAGAVVRFIDWNGGGYFASYINHIFAESLGQWGNFNSGLACAVTNCHIDFALEYEGNDITKTVITSWGENVVYRSCNFRFYDGLPHDVKVEGNAYWDHCNVGLKNVTGKFNQ